MALSLANIGLPDFITPHEVTTLFSSSATYALLGAFAALFLILTLLWYRRIPAASSQTAEWFLTAGRNMKSGIVAASIVCTWTWAATVMVSSAKGYQHGIAGPYWYAAGATTPLLLFAVLAIYLKRRAPMAHTFGEFVWHRFGGPSHRLMVGLGLLTCAIVTAMVVLGGAYALRTLIGLDVRVAVLMIPLFFAFYSAIGGLRGSIVVEYVQMVILMVIALGLTIWFWTSYGDLGIFERLHALTPREGETYLTVASLSALLFGIVNTIGNLGTVFMDQTYWQRAIAASKESAGRSFLIGGLAWFAIPFGVATALGVGGLALGLAVPFPYTDIAPTTAAAVFGPLGTWLFLIMLFMAIISTGNAESVAVASLVATDIYKTYVRPQASDGDILRIARRATLAFALLIGPACLALHTLTIDMEWLYLTMGIFVGAGAIPLALGLLTDRLTGRGAYWATLGGLVIGLMGWMTAAHEMEGAITFETLGRLGPVTIGNLAVILTSALICGIDCARPHARFRFELLRDAIRSYLAPPIDTGIAGTPPHSSASLSGQERRLIGWVVGSTILLELIVPGGLYVSGIQFGRELFAAWVILSLVWLLMAAGFIILLPIKDHFEIDYPERLVPTRVEEHGWRTAVPDSIGNRLFLSFLTVVLMLGVGAIVSLVKLGSIEYLREVNERVMVEESLHEDMVSLLIPEALKERSRGELDGPASAALSERVKLLFSSPYTPTLLRSMVSSPGAHYPILYLSFEEKERTFIADSIGATYRGTSVANISRMSQQRRQAIVLILVSLVGTLTVGLMLTIRTSAAITRPIRRLAEASRRFAAGDPPAPPVPVDTADEIGVLTEEFNEMAAHIREQVTALKAAEEEFRLIVSHVNDAIVYLDVEGGIRWGNDQACVLLGRPSDKILGLPIVSVLTPKSAMLTEERLAAVRHGESVPPLVELGIVHPNGEIVSVEANAASVRKNGKIVGRLLVFRDITERKQTEETIREKEKRIRAIFNQAPLGIAVINSHTGQFLEINNRYCEIVGFSEEEMLSRTFQGITHPQDLRADLNNMKLLLEGKIESFEMDKRYIRKDNSMVWIRLTVVPLWWGEEQPRLHIAMVNDITARKRAEEALQMQASVLGSMLEGVSLSDENGVILYTNPAEDAIFGYEPGELIGKHVTVLNTYPPEENARIVEGVIEQLKAKGSWEGEFSNRRKDGTEFTTFAHITALELSGKKHWVCVQADITKRKRTEEAVRYIKDQLQAILDHSPAIIYIKDLTGHHLLANRQFEALLSLTHEQIIGKTNEELFSRKTADAFRANDLKVMESGRPLQFEETLQLKDGLHTFVSIKFLLRGNPGHPYALCGISTDITERKRAEDALRALVVGTASVTGKEFFPVFVRQLAAAVGTRYAFVTELVGDEQARVRVIAIWMGDRLGTPFEYDLIHTPCEKVFNQGRAYHPESVQEIYPKDKDLVVLGAMGYLGITLVDSSGKPIGHVCVLDDKPLREESAITSIMSVFAARAAAELERKRAEEERARLLKEVQDSHERLQHLSRRMLEVQEEERRRLARELHDQAGQSLTSLLIGLRILEEMPTLAQAQAQAGDLRKITAQALDEVKRLAMGLRPALLDDLGLEAALKRLAKESAQTYRVSMDLHIKGLTNRRLPPPVEMGLYRIAQEALTNAGRHAAAKNVSILLTCSESSVKLIIEDDGRGFDVEKALRLPGSSNHLGLLGMHERVSLLNGTISVESTPGSGTTIYVQLSLEARPS